MAWNNAVVTNNGIALLQHVIAGQTLIFDGASGGTGTVTASVLMAQTALVNQKQTFPVVGAMNVPNGKKLNLMISSTGLITGYTMQQVGIWAHVGAGASVLFAILQDSVGIIIPSEAEIPDYALNLYAVVEFSNESEFSLNIDPSAMVTIGAMNEAFINNSKYRLAGGTATEIVLSDMVLEDGFSITFIVSADNNGAATKINSKPLYKPKTTVAPTLKEGKAITVWYNAVGDCFFIKASAEGDAIAENVLAEKTFSNDDDTGIPGTMANNGPVSAEAIDLTSENADYTIPKGYHSGLRKIRAKITGLVASVIKAGVTVGGILGTFTSDATAVAGDMLLNKTAYKDGSKLTGTMPDRGTVNATLPINGSFAIPAGKHSGSGKVTQDVPTKGAQIYTPGTIDQTIASGRYLSGTQTIKGDANLIPANILQGKSIFGVAGDVVAGKKFASGVVTSSTVAENISAPDGSSKSLYPFEVTGLDFTPRVILVHHYTGNQISMVGIYNRDFRNSFMGSSITQSGGTGGSWNTRITYPAHINETGFRLHGSYGGAAVTWQAFD